MPTQYKKEHYNYYRKEVCDNKDVWKPKHSISTILCLLEEILENQKNSKFEEDSELPKQDSMAKGSKKK